MFQITHAMWSKGAIGIAAFHLIPGDNVFEVTIKTPLTEPGIFSINRENAIDKYGLESINKKGVIGIWVPFSDLKKMGVPNG